MIVVASSLGGVLWSAGTVGASWMENAQSVKGDLMMEKRHLTREQEELLLGISVNEKKVLSGELYEWQEELLRQYEYVRRYLSDKYPSHEFEITGCAPISAQNMFASFWFRADGAGQIYELHLYEKEEDRLTETEGTGRSEAEGELLPKPRVLYECEDNYYNAVLSPAYAEKLKERLRTAVPECCKVVTEFISLQGEQYGETYDSARLLDGEEQLPNHTSIYLSCRGIEEWEKLSSEVEAWIKENGIYGSYSVFFASDSEALKEVEEENPDYVLRKDFQHFQ